MSTFAGLKFGMQTQLDSANNMGVQSVSPVKYHKHIYMTTPLSALKKLYFFFRKSMQLNPQTHI